MIKHAVRNFAHGAIEGKRVGICDLNVTSLPPPLATRHTLCAAIAQIS